MSDVAEKVPLNFKGYMPEEMQQRSKDFRALLAQRRSVRDFRSDAVPDGVIEECIAAANLAPSGANKQPWTFVLVCGQKTKREIRQAAEQEERAFYRERAPQKWLEDLAPFGTDENKPFLTDAPALIVVFAQRRGTTSEDRHYYVMESVGIAVGFLLAALHNAGLAALTHTPSPMGFLGPLLGRPKNERAFLLIPVGYPKQDCHVPAISRKPLDQAMVKVPEPNS